MRISAVFEDEFYHDGRGPELQKVVWKSNGIILVGFEYYNPDDVYSPGNLKHLTIDRIEAFSMASDEVHGNIFATGGSQAAIFEIGDSPWLASFNQSHLAQCSHFQIMFYDEIYDVICRKLKFGTGQLNA